MSALTDQWLLVMQSTATAQNTVLDIASAECGGNPIERDSRVAAFQAVQDAQLADLDSKIQALQALLAPPP